MSDPRPNLLFVSPRFLFPIDSGGKIRTTQVLRGMKGQRFAITLASPVPPNGRTRHAAELDSVCDRFVGWPERVPSRLFPLLRLRHLAASLPVPVATDRDPAALAAVGRLLDEKPDVAVFDFIHAVVLGPAQFPVPAVMFTHNVEAEIFRRHAETAANRLKRLIWRDQHRKMEAFERRHLARFDAVVAVSERDADFFRKEMGIAAVRTIPTGVDLDFLDYAGPADAEHVVITAGMDWFANIDGVEFFMDEIWPLITARRPNARMTVVGRNPPPRLCEKARAKGLAWTFTGFVDDVRPYVRDAAVYVIPLRVGGGTRLKAYEAMALGCPVVSTTIGVEGLPLDDGTHYLQADSPADFAAAVLRLMTDKALRQDIAKAARAHVEANFGADVVARAFEAICADVVKPRAGA